MKNEPIRILHMIASLSIGGSQSMVLNLYKAIDRETVQFDFIIDHPEDAVLKPEIEALGGKVYELPTFVGKNIRQVKRAWDAFFTEHPEYRILHSHSRSYASVYIPIAKKHGLTTIIHSHNTSNGSGVTAAAKAVLQYPLRYRADYLMACSNEAGRWLYGKKACRKDNYIFLPNAIDTEKFRYSKETAEKYRKDLELEGKFVLGHVGRLSVAKNHMFLLDVFSKVTAKRADARLLLVGDGECRKAIEQKIRTLNLEDKVIMTGSRNDIPELLQAMDIFVFPSSWEGLPVSVVEAQAAGLPCLISDKITKDVDLTELVRRLPIDSLDAWADAIINTDCSRKDVVSKIRQAGFDVHDTARKLTDFYLSHWKE